MLSYPMHRTGVTASFGMYSPFGTPNMHYALDISRTQPKSFNVFAAHDGDVLVSAFDYSGGNIIVIKGEYNDKKDVITRYCHLKSRRVKKWDRVKRGEIIGVQGNTGTASTAQHLHFETWLVPKDYTYNFADRAVYAVDPLSVCELMPEQDFFCDKYTFGFQAIPYPEPRPAELQAVEARVTACGGEQLSLVPSKKYSPLVAGYNRTKSTVSDFLNERSFEAVYRCENEGKSFAGIITEFGLLWIMLGEGIVYEQKSQPNEQERRLEKCERILGSIKNLMKEI